MEIEHEEHSPDADGSACRSRLETVYESSARKKKLFITATVLLLVAATIVSLSIGSVDIPVTDTLRAIGHALLPSAIAGPERYWYSQIVINSRMSRVLLCILCGISLAIAGTVMQGLLRNPLVSPFTLGLSSAASFGAAMAIVFGGTVTGYVLVFGIKFYAENLLIAVMAFLCGLASISLVLLLSRRSDISRSTIILAGVVISYLFQAGVSLTKYLSDDDALREITLWLMGGMWNATWSVDLIVAGRGGGLPAPVEYVGTDQCPVGGG